MMGINPVKNLTYIKFTCTYKPTNHIPIPNFYYQLKMLAFTQKKPISWLYESLEKVIPWVIVVIETIEYACCTC